jgi:hypothetical protein
MLRGLWAGRASERALRQDWQRRKREVRQQLAEALATPDKPNDTITRRTTMSTIEVPSYQAVPEDTYVVELVEFSEPKDGDFGAYTYMRCKILEGEYAGVEVSVVCSLKLSPKAKLTAFMKVLLNRELEPGEKLDLNAIAAKHPRMKALVVSKFTAAGGEISTIEKLIRIAPARGKPVEATVAASSEDDEVPF